MRATGTLFTVRDKRRRREGSPSKWPVMRLLVTGVVNAIYRRLRQEHGGWPFNQMCCRLQQTKRNRAIGQQLAVMDFEFRH